MKSWLSRAILIVVSVITLQTLTWEGTCLVRVFANTQRSNAEQKLCEDAGQRSVNVLTSVLATLLALLVRQEDAEP